MEPSITESFEWNALFISRRGFFAVDGKTRNATQNLNQLPHGLEATLGGGQLLRCNLQTPGGNYEGVMCCIAQSGNTFCVKALNGLCRFVLRRLHALERMLLPKYPRIPETRATILR